MRRATNDGRPVRAALGNGIAEDPGAALEALANQCGQLSAIREALRSAYCDWQLGDDLSEPGTFSLFRESRLAADCLALDGQRKEHEGDWAGAALSYLEEIAFAGDLGTGDLLMARAGMAVAEDGLDRLGTLAASPAGEGTDLSGASRQLEEIAQQLPSVATGFQVERLRLAAALAAEERAQLVQRSGLLRFPWRAVVAWRLSRGEALLKRLQEAINCEDAARWNQAIGDLERASNLVRQGFPYLREAWGASRRLSQRQLAVLLTFRLRDWRARNGSYPTTLSELGLPSSFSAIRYSGTDDGNGYQIWSDEPSGAEEGHRVLFERSSTAVSDTPSR
jgi:hypothetical protein